MLGQAVRTLAISTAVILTALMVALFIGALESAFQQPVSVAPAWFEGRAPRS